jgi:hypothetical protein
MPFGLGVLIRVRDNGEDRNASSQSCPPSLKACSCRIRIIVLDVKTKTDHAVSVYHEGYGREAGHAGTGLKEDAGQIANGFVTLVFVVFQLC